MMININNTDNYMNQKAYRASELIQEQHQRIRDRRQSNI
jgi:hypothetical protein